MLFDRLTNLNKSLIFRMTVWYAIIFAITAYISLSIFYLRIQAITLEQTDAELIKEIDEFASLMQKEGLSGVIAELKMEAEEEQAEEVFYRLLTHAGQEIQTTDLKPWGAVEAPQEILSTLTENNNVLKTLTIPGHEYKARIIYSIIGTSEILQIGLSLQEAEEYLGIFRTLLLILMPSIFIVATFIGWLIAKKSLAGIEEVTQTATEISKGHFNKRVGTHDKSTEVERLASTFNHMVNQLQKLITSMKDMTDTIAHDLRSPLARIRGIAEMTLLGKAEKKEFEEMAASTIEECDNLTDMVNAMLDISEAEAGIIELNIVELDLTALIKEACELFSSVAIEKHIDLKFDLPAKVTLKSDKHKLQRILTNLLENAIKYTPEGGSISVTIEAKQQYVNIMVKDTGIGISDTELPYIFNRFYRGDASRTHAGFGLGLSLVKVFVEALQGTISVSNKDPRGSIFKVTMPA